MFLKSAKRISSVLILVFFAQTLSFAQVESLRELQSKLSEFSNNNYQEKLFLHIDKSFYLTGEHVWFKIYNLDAVTHKPNELSKIAYVEILDVNKTSVVQAKIDLKDSSNSGTLYLPNTLNSGNYTIRAYTSWMENFSPEYYFHKQITIVNTTRKLGKKDEETNTTFDIAFFPEGGNLVENLESKVAFRAFDNNGRGIDFKGYILNSLNDTLAKFQPMKFGIGTFLFKPVAGEKYRSVIITPERETLTKELPNVYESGYVIRLSDLGDRLKMDVFFNGTSTNSARVLYVIGHTRQEIKVAEYNFLVDNKTSFVVEKKKLGNGITHLTLFNDLKQPLCERLYFKQPEQKLNLQLDINKQNFASREKVSLELTSQDEQLSAKSANLSMSVFLLDSLERISEDDINSYLWLSSDLIGKIESPKYYLSSDDKVAQDNLMLTHGWRRFKWETVLSGNRQPLTFIPETHELLIAAKVTNKNTTEGARNIYTYLSVPGKAPQFYVAKTDSTGRALFPVSRFYANNDIILQTNTEKDSIYKIELSSPFSDKFSASRRFNVPFNLSENSREQILNRSISSQVETNYLREKKNRYSIPKVDSLTFFVRSDKSYLLDAYTRFPTMEEVMREYVPEVTVRRRKGEYHYHVLDKPHELFFENDPLVLLDGLPIFDVDKIMQFDPLKVKRMDVITGRYFYGPLLSEGIVNYTTYGGDLAGYELDPRALLIEYEGLQLQRQFYSPSYEEEQQKASRIPDFRNLLFWSSSLNVDNSGKKTVEFYTSDAVGKYALVVNGISKDGRAGSQILIFEVKKPL